MFDSTILLSTVPADQTVMGVGVALLSLIGLRYESWLLEESGRLRWGREQFGDGPTMAVLRLALFGGVTFGALLAAGVINPLHPDSRATAAPAAVR